MKEYDQINVQIEKKLMKKTMKIIHVIAYCVSLLAIQQNYLIKDDKLY